MNCKRKSKFHVGQVVYDRCSGFTKITKRYKMLDGRWYYDLDTLFKDKAWRLQIAECNLHRLTTNERKI